MRYDDLNRLLESYVLQVLAPLLWTRLFVAYVWAYYSGICYVTTPIALNIATLLHAPETR